MRRCSAPQESAWARGSPSMKRCSKSSPKRALCWKGRYRDHLVAEITSAADYLYRSCVKTEKTGYHERDRKIDKILTSKVTGIPIMLLFLGGILWLTIEGANYPSQLLSNLLFGLEEKLLLAFEAMHAPVWLTGLLVTGVYRTLAWVVSVMLPPMALFFPLFTLLEDFGYLPRIAFNLDHYFKKPVHMANRRSQPAWALAATPAASWAAASSIRPGNASSPF